MNKSHSTRLAMLLAATSMAPAMAHAQSAPSAPDQAAQADKTDSIGEIVVTAQRREESAQKIGIAITAVGGKELSSLGITTSTEIAKLSPGVTATGAQGGFLQTFSIRGVTQNDFQPHQEAPVAAYIDDVYISSLMGQSFAVFDPDRVEILKGPQGTLFGRNATGGLIHYVTAKPKLGETSGYVGASYGRFNAYQLDGAVNLPLGPTLALRASGTYSHHDPILKNKVGPDQWDGKMGAGRIHLLWEPSNSFKELLSARYGRASTTVSVANVYPAAIPIFNAAGLQTDEMLAPGANPTSLTTSDPLVGKPVTVTTSPTDPRSFSESYGVTSNTQVRAGEVSISAILDYSHFKWRVGSSLTNLFPFGFDTQAKGIDQISGELRVSGNHGPLRWVVGIYGLGVKSNNGAAYGDVANIVFSLPPPFGISSAVPSDEAFTFHQNTHSVSGFGQVEYDLTDKLTAIGGVRYIHETKTFDYQGSIGVTKTSAGFPLALPFNQTNYPALVPDKENLVSWKVGLNYKATPDVLLYATINRGVKAGGFNAPSQPLPASFLTFRPEVLIAYEAGFKSTLADHRLLINGSAFYYDYQNYQAFLTLGNVTYLSDAKARNYGAEIQVSAIPATGLTTSISAAVMNNKVFNITLGGVTADRKSAFSPDFQLSGQIRYEVPTGFGKAWGQVDGSYTSSYFVQLSNFTALKNTSYAQLNARVGIGSAGEKGWSLIASVSNLTNKRYLTSGFATASNYGADILAYSMPRTWQIAAHYAF